jgi:NADH:ubiquinone oxidoreductase subunit 2 (subunit N)
MLTRLTVLHNRCMMTNAIHELYGLVLKSIYIIWYVHDDNNRKLNTQGEKAAKLSLFPATMSCMILAFFCSSASLLTSWNTSSICSSVLPAVSGTQKKVKMKASKQNTAKNV